VDASFHPLTTLNSNLIWGLAARRYIEDVMTAAIAPLTKGRLKWPENTEDR
jgi:hypothetical protein